MKKAPFVTTLFKTEGVHGPIFERLRYTDTCKYPYLKVTFSDQVTCIFLFQLLILLQLLCKIIGTTQPEEIITDPAEGVGIEM